jgi:hypothetical protein
LTDFFHSHGLLSLGCVLYPLVAGEETHAMSTAPKISRGRFARETSAAL